MNSWLLAVYAEIEAVKAEIEGMKALNQYRTSRDETIAYDEESFIAAAETLRKINERIMFNR